MEQERIRREDLSPLGAVGSRLRRGAKREARAEQVIVATPEEVWRIVSDVERVHEWWPRAVAGLVASGDAAGREQVVTLDWGSRKGHIRQRVTQWEPGRRYGWRVLSEMHGDKALAPLVDSTVTIEIGREGALARVVISGTFEPAGPRGALAVRQLLRLARKTYRRALKNLDELARQR